MASDGNPGSVLIATLVQGVQAPATVNVQQPSGKSVPTGGNHAAQGAPASNAGAAAPAAPLKSEAQSLVELLNKYLNDSGRPEQFRVAPASGSKLIQEINPTTGEVIGEFSASEFPALARSVGVTGLLVDSRA